VSISRLLLTSIVLPDRYNARQLWFSTPPLINVSISRLLLTSIVLPDRYNARQLWAKGYKGQKVRLLLLMCYLRLLVLMCPSKVSRVRREGVFINVVSTPPLINVVSTHTLINVSFKGFKGQKVRVAVFDTGVDTQHRMCSL
jgi:subtilisin family serine protease